MTIGIAARQNRETNSEATLHEVEIKSKRDT